MCVCVCVLVAQLCSTLCDPMDCGLPGSSVHGILQVRILEPVAIFFSREGIFLTQESNLDLLHCKQILYCLSHQGSPAAAAAAKSLQSCPTLCDPIDSSPPSSAVPGILQARTLEWVAISFSKKRDEKDSYHLNYI